MLKVKTILKQTKRGNYKSSDLDNLDRKCTINNDKDIKMPDDKHITFINDFFISKCITSIQLRLGIQSTWNMFKFIKFDNGQENK